MTTKTLTITEDAYNLLKVNKYDDESFSDEIQRILGRTYKKKLVDFAGILSDREGELLLSDLAAIKEKEIRLLKRRIQ